MIKKAIEKIVEKINLTEKEMGEVFSEIMSGGSTGAQIGAFLAALRMKGETVGEITGAAKVMRKKSARIDAGKDLIDTCGTGGSLIDTFNISTIVAFVVSGAGLKVAKHGNRAASGCCGSADVLEELGIDLDAPPKTVARCIREIGIGFIYAPLFHKAMKHASGPRKEIGIRTIFNILGPLSNPANAKSQVLGVYDAALTEVMAGVLKNLGLRRAMVVHGSDGLDEITISGSTKITELKGGKVRTYRVTPEKFGIKRSRLDCLKGGNTAENADIVLSILEGERSPRRDVVLVNASAALVCGGKAKDFREGVKLAAESIDSGKALDKLLKLIKFTKR